MMLPSNAVSSSNSFQFGQPITQTMNNVGGNANQNLNLTYNIPITTGVPLMPATLPSYSAPQPPVYTAPPSYSAPPAPVYTAPPQFSGYAQPTYAPAPQQPIAAPILIAPQYNQIINQMLQPSGLAQGGFQPTPAPMPPYGGIPQPQPQPPQQSPLAKILPLLLMLLMNFQRPSEESPLPAPAPEMPPEPAQ